ncbi:patatin-like phospholipase family protein [Luteolibacter flavescens]|uniref:Patatin-like phospholipase family protein n=1 Tax=Luteolibacter flavescens TaxID=1859460 RepID=A0ABT3FQ62_9BACT|nr:patatin-like phospholipase family protein [Luteolibacter flavescens]MCW1885720.1 patatin-like phospholipase family protein [Luteolibacter flavescens]
MSGMPPEPGHDPGLAVCLSSSFFGYYAHLGLLGAMEEAGLRPGRIAGASAGALAGGLWAAGLRGAALERVIYDFHFRRAFFDLGAFYRWPGIFSGLAGAGLLSGVRIRRYLRRVIGELRIEDLDSPRLEIAVANITKGCSEVRTRGPLIDFLIASCAVPILFQPQRIGGEEFLDGGVANETPFDHWLDDPAIHTIVVHRIQHSSCMKGLPWRTPGGMMGECHRVVSGELLRRRTEDAMAAGKQLIFLETAHDHPGLLHGGKSRTFFAAGAATFRQSSLCTPVPRVAREIPLSPAERAS